MLKNILIILLLTVLSVRPAFYVGNVVYYQTHINEVIEKYCINKDKPQLQCNGQCHLAKQMSAVNTDDSSDVLVDISTAFFPVYFQEIQKISIIVNGFTQTNSFYTYSTLYKSSHSSNVDRPPIV